MAPNPHNGLPAYVRLLLLAIAASIAAALLWLPESDVIPKRARRAEEPYEHRLDPCGGRELPTLLTAWPVPVHITEACSRT